MRQVPVWCDEHSHSQASQALTGNKWTKREYWVGHLIMSCINSCLYHKSTIVSLMSVINLSCRLKVFHGDSTVTKNKGPTLFMPEHKEDLYNVVLDWLVCIWRLVGVNVNVPLASGEAERKVTFRSLHSAVNQSVLVSGAREQPAHTQQETSTSCLL